MSRAPLLQPVIALLIAAAVCVLAADTNAQAVQGRKEPRLALVIGNGAYQVSPLTNPVNDARAMAEALKETGFTVIRKENASLKEMTLALREFGDKLKHGGVGLFYYAGHGMAVKGRNYLIPVGAQIEREDEIAFNALDASAVLDKMESAGNRLNLVILDACRNNPFARSFRSANQGLAQMDAPVGTLVSFATAPGQVASDGNGRNGLFTQHLLENIRRPGLKIEDLFKAVRVNVRKDSGGKQVPWEASSLEGDFYFNIAASEKPVAASKAAAATAVPPVATAEKTRAPSIPFPAGAPVVYPGDNWTYRHTDLKNNSHNEYTNMIEEVAPGRIKFRGGNYITDQNQNVLYDRARTKDKVTESRFDPGLPLMLFPAQIGEGKSGTVIVSRTDDERSEQHYDIKILRRERVSVPAGTFDAMYLERELTFRTQFRDGRVNNGRTKTRIWYAPQAKRFVKYEIDTIDSKGVQTPTSRRELLSYQVTQ